MGQLAHELNSLLDGSLRSISLALRDLAEAGPADDVTGRLKIAQEAMHQMASMLEKAMGPYRGSSHVLARSRPLGLEIEHAVEMVRPMARDLSVQLGLQVAPEAACLPAGPLAAVLINGLRNAVQACARNAPGLRRHVGLDVRADDDRVRIEICDTGPGPGAGTGAGSLSGTEDGHGLGLDLCDRIVTELGGSLELCPGPEGTSLRVEVPGRSLRSA